MNTAVVVQCTSSDLLSSSYQAKSSGDLVDEDAFAYAVGALRGAELGPVVLAAPDTAENRTVIPALADRWRVAFHLGEEHDVVGRLLDAAASQNATVLARVVMASFYVEPEIVRSQIALLQATGADYCTVPRDFNINFAADVVRTTALARLPEMCAELPPTLRGTARYRPWPFIERRPDLFSIAILDELPVIGTERLDWIRSQLNWPERSGPGYEGGEYHEFASEFVKETDAVLDAGCGHGQITGILAEYARSVVGVDYDADMVALARERFPEAEFEVGDLQTWRRPATFDVIFHCHTLEHLPDAVAALDNLKASLKPQGMLVVEVPLELRPGTINPHHEREYTSDMLIDELHRAGLDVTETRGVSRGIYGPPDTAREALVAVCVARAPETTA